MNPSQVSVLGRVDREKTIKKSETSAGKKKRIDESPKPSSKKKSSSKPRSDKLRDLDKKWSEWFSRPSGYVVIKDLCCPCGACEETPFSGYQ